MESFKERALTMTREEGIEFLNNSDECPKHYGLDNYCDENSCLDCIKKSIENVKFKDDLVEAETENVFIAKEPAPMEKEIILTDAELIQKYKELVGLLMDELECKASKTSIYHYMSKMRPDLYGLIKEHSDSQIKNINWEV